MGCGLRRKKRGAAMNGGRQKRRVGTLRPFPETAGCRGAGEANIHCSRYMCRNRHADIIFLRVTKEEKSMKEQKKNREEQPLDKNKQLAESTEDGMDQYLTTNPGVRVNDDQPPA